MILLYAANSSDFNQPPLAYLNDAVSCTVKEELNGVFDLELEFSMNAKHFKEIQLRRIILCRVNPYSDYQPFRIHTINKPISGIVKIVANHYSYDLGDIVCKEFKANGLIDSLNKMKANAVVGIPFDFVADYNPTDEFEVDKPDNMRTILSDIIKKYKAEVTFNGTQIALRTKRGSNSGVSIRYGKNLLDFKQEEICSNMYAFIYPFWKQNIRNGDKDETKWTKLDEQIMSTSSTFNYSRILALDLSSEFNDQPTQEQLRERTRKYIADNKLTEPKVSMDLSFVQLSRSKEYVEYGQLESIQVGDTLMVDFFKAGIQAEARCISIEYDVVLNKYTRIQLGDPKVTVGGSIVDGVNGSKEAVKNVSNAQVKFDYEIGSIKIDVAHIKNVVANSVTTDYLEANFAKLKNAVIDVAQIGDATITNAKIANLNAEKITAGDISADRIKTNVITAVNASIDKIDAKNIRVEDIVIDGAQITNATIDAAQIKDAAIGTAQIKDAAITNAKIGDLNANKITAGDIDAERIKANVISAINADITTATIKEAKIGDLSADKITAGDISADRIKTNVIDAVNAAIGTINSDKITVGDLDAGSIKTGDLSADVIKTNVISAINASVGKIDADHITVGNIDAGAITTGSLDAGRIAVGSLNGDKITANTITSKEIKTGTITASEISTDTINAITASAGTIVAGDITSGKVKITDANILDATISGAKITAASIKTAQIEDAAITNAKIDSLSASKLTAGKIDAKDIEVVNLKADNITVGTINGNQISNGAIGWSKIDELLQNRIVSSEDDIKGALEDMGIIDGRLDGIDKSISDTTTAVNTAKNDASAAKSLATTASTNATTAITTANTASSTATTAKNTADTAISTANTANSTATTANTNANTAISTANTAKGTADSANSKIDGLVVGGTNIALNTNKGKTGWNVVFDTVAAPGASATVEDWDINGVSGVKITRNSVATGGWGSYVSYASTYVNLTKYKPSTTYTISFDMYCSTDYSDQTINIMTGTYQLSLLKSVTVIQSTVKAGTWSKCIYRVVTHDTLPTLSGQVLYFSGYPGRVGVVTGYVNLKIEESTINTAWSPAPEDISNSINAAMTAANGKNKVFYQSTSPSTSQGLTVGDTWFNTSDGNRIYKWTGTVWETTQLGANAIANAAIVNAHIADATISSAKISGLDAGKINAGTISVDRLGALSITAAKIAAGAIETDKLAANAVTAAKIVAGAISTSHLAANAVTAEKIVSKAITTDKLDVDNLFVGDNAFIKSLQAMSIDAAQIKTGIISNDRIDIRGLVKFESLDADLSKLFSKPVVGGPTYINGGTISTDSIKANSLDLYSGITVKNNKLEDTFKISEQGDIFINGTMQSSNYIENQSGYQINTNGVAEFNQVKVRGDVILPNAGITNAYDMSQVAGRNLIRNTASFINWGNNGTLETFNGTASKAIVLTRTGAASGAGRYQLGSPTFTSTGNLSYTFSGYIYIDSSVALTDAANNDVAIRCNRPEGIVNICVVSYNAFEKDKWIYFSKTDKTPATITSAFVLLSISLNGKVKFAQLKCEIGDSATPYSPAPEDYANPVRFWAGKDYDNRDTAPFRVLQNGDVYATNTTLSGILYGQLEAGRAHVSNGQIRIDTDDNATNGNDAINMSANGAIFKTDVSIGNMQYENGNNILKTTNTSLLLNGTGQTNIEFNGKTTGAVSGLILRSNVGGGGVQAIRHSSENDKAGTLVFDSEGNQGAIGDFSFTRLNYTADAKVDIDGSLVVKTKITGKSSPVEMRYTSTGIDFYV